MSKELKNQNRMKKRKAWATRRKSLRISPSDACQVFLHAKHELNENESVILVTRVSGWEQKRNKNDDSQMNSLIEFAIEKKAKIVGCYSHVGSGFITSWLYRPFSLARELNASVLFESTCRAIRHPCYRKNAQKFRASKVELDDVTEIAAGLKIMTILHPNEENDKVRSFETKRGNRFRKLKAKSTKRRLLLPTAKRLHQEGMPARQIARSLLVPHRTVVDWLRRNA